ncbi:MAG TPA: DNA-binding protein [Casimicrobiaceae bacterium]|jgi:phosphomannomutase|nr:DNA-binding protein [Casimicrobiaceae bacterium]HET9747676.1 DNA-binding protein [Casimicrobiaceae bacterium]HWD17245.1 DNA-binding protein [Casimicrobiaceae bacterium]
MVVLEVRPLHEELTKVASAMRSGAPEPNARIAFATPELLLQVLTLGRWVLLKTLCGAGRITIAEVARRLNRDVMGVEDDVRALADAGMVEYANGQVEFPFDRIKVEFMLEAA